MPLTGSRIQQGVEADNTRQRCSAVDPHVEERGSCCSLQPALEPLSLGPSSWEGERILGIIRSHLGPETILPKLPAKATDNLLRLPCLLGILSLCSYRFLQGSSPKGRARKQQSTELSGYFQAVLPIKSADGPVILENQHMGAAQERGGGREQRVVWTSLSS